MLLRLCVACEQPSVKDADTDDAGTGCASTAGQKYVDSQRSNRWNRGREERDCCPVMSARTHRPVAVILAGETLLIFVRQYQKPQRERPGIGNGLPEWWLGGQT